MVPDLAEHARFFDHLVELVPAKFYYGDDYERVMPRHLAKAARAAFKADVKFKAKIAKREKLDPTTAATTLEVQRRKAQANPDDGDGKGPSPSGRKNADAVAVQPSEDQPAAAKGLNLQLSGAALSRQQLLDRLHKKVEEARQRRKAPENTAAKAREWRQNTLRGNVAAKQQQQQQQQQQMLAGAKRKNSAAEEPATGSDTPGGGKHAKLQGQGPQLAKKVRREDHGGASSGEEQLDFKFARIEVEDGGRYGKHAGARKPSKHVLLKQVEAKKAEMEALEGTEEGKAKTQQEAWKTAMARAAGEKVLDDPKLLRRSLKRESKRRAQHSKAWQVCVWGGPEVLCVGGMVCCILRTGWPKPGLCICSAYVRHECVL
ncbi:hypothetical protein Vretimale_11211 [Volvox reticuliferus]|uniref:Ribosomal RNA-processing protein 14 N-terminal domain-containing protein n=1 Tax=Volvox reticuliferus TaxID=1737510 RepID=A0A8J4GG61_9CHLO|nr:hypothetical protein Vretimale_11211 [Volvox reticuliferus]